jgi:hypothetical protein
MRYPDLELIAVTMHPAGLPITGEIATTYRVMLKGQPHLLHGSGCIDPDIPCPDPACFCHTKDERWTPDGQYGAIIWERDGQAYWEYASLPNGKLYEAGRPVASLDQAKLIVDGYVFLHQPDAADEPRLGFDEECL